MQILKWLTSGLSFEAAKRGKSSSLEFHCPPFVFGQCSRRVGIMRQGESSSSFDVEVW